MRPYKSWLQQENVDSIETHEKLSSPKRSVAYPTSNENGEQKSTDRVNDNENPWALPEEDDNINERDQNLLLCYQSMRSTGFSTRTGSAINKITKFIVEHKYDSLMMQKQQPLIDTSESGPENSYSINISEEAKGNGDDHDAPKIIITAERIFVVINFILEVPSAIFNQVSSVNKAEYALISMLMSFTAMLICIIELVYKGGVERVGWRWREKIPWFYYPSPSNRPFGGVTDIIGLLCAILQCIFAAIGYACYLAGMSDNPIKISVWPLIFALCLLCFKFSKNPHEKML
ncbi:hypothetical protein ACOSQ2_004452 [Xanthoceras sorbifolium]